MNHARLIPLALLATLALQAEPPRYGVQGLVNIPIDDLKDYVDSRPGPGVGVHGTFDLGGGHVLRPRLDFTAYPEATFASVKQDATALALGGDYLYFFAERPERLYLTGGLAIVRWSFGSRTGAADTTARTTKLGAAVGIGYQWNATVGTELRLVHSSIHRTFQADAIQAGVTIRF